MGALKAQIICDADQRDSERYAVKENAEALVPGVDSLPCVVLDISESGARVSLSDESVAVPDNLKLYIAERDLIADCRVAWRKGKEFGVLFESTAIF